jgi:hypothetical protein
MELLSLRFVFQRSVAGVWTQQAGILVIFGAGHFGLLQHDVANDPNLPLRKLTEFAR